jgi:hypothetical protein
VFASDSLDHLHSPCMQPSVIRYCMYVPTHIRRRRARMCRLECDFRSSGCRPEWIWSMLRLLFQHAAARDCMPNALVSQACTCTRCLQHIHMTTTHATTCSSATCTHQCWPERLSRSAHTLVSHSAAACFSTAIECAHVCRCR